MADFREVFKVACGKDLDEADDERHVRVGDLRDALTVIEAAHPVPNRRLEALRQAREHVAATCVAPLNARGYVIDGYKPPGPDAQHHMVLETAEFILKGELP